MTRFHSDSRKLIVRFCMLANLSLWLLMWFTFFDHAKRYVYRGEPIEGPYPWQVVFGWAVSPITGLMPYWGYKLVFILNFPTYILSLLGFNLLFHGQRLPQQYFRTTVGGYELIVWMILSFVQWYIIDIILARMWTSFRHRAGTSVVPGSMGPAN